MLKNVKMRDIATVLSPGLLTGCADMLIFFAAFYENLIYWICFAPSERTVPERSGMGPEQKPALI